MFPYLPGQSGYNKRLRKMAVTMAWLIRMPAMDTSVWTTTYGWWTPPRSNAAGPGTPSDRSDLAGYTQYGYCASHSPWFWGLRLHLLCTLHGLPVGFALAGAKADERQVLLAILDERRAGRPAAGQMLIGDNDYFGRDFGAALARPGCTCCARPAAASTRTPRQPVLQAAAPDHRVGQRHLQRPARPRTPRRADPSRGHHPHPAAHPGPDRRDLAQRPNRASRSCDP